MNEGQPFVLIALAKNGNDFLLVEEHDGRYSIPMVITRDSDRCQAMAGLTATVAQYLEGGNPQTVKRPGIFMYLRADPLPPGPTGLETFVERPIPGDVYSYSIDAQLTPKDGATLTRFPLRFPLNHDSRKILENAVRYSVIQ